MIKVKVDIGVEKTNICGANQNGKNLSIFEFLRSAIIFLFFICWVKQFKIIGSMFFKFADANQYLNLSIYIILKFRYAKKS